MTKEQFIEKHSHQLHPHVSIENMSGAIFDMISEEIDKETRIPGLVIEQIKSKFGQLRCYVESSDKSEKMNKYIFNLEDRISMRAFNEKIKLHD